MPVTTKGTQLTGKELYSLALQVGFPAGEAKVMAAICLAESGGWTASVGDQALETSVWGPSIGLGQVRTLKAERGRGTTRDETILTDPLTNLRSCYSIFRDRARTGKDGFTAWTTYTEGAYKRYLTAVERGKQVGSDDPAIAAASGGTGTAVGGIDNPSLAVGGLDRALDVSLLTPVSALTIDGLTDLPSALTSARVSLSTGQVSEIVCTFVDPELRVAKTSGLIVGAEIGSFAGWSFRVAAIEISPKRSVVTLRSAIAQNLKHTPYVGPYGWNSMSPSQVLATVARYVVAQPTAVRDNLTINGPDAGPSAASTKKNPETFWEGFQRWADEEGMWLFESRGTVYLGKPSWLVAVLPVLTINWAGQPDGGLLELPTIRVTEDADETVTVTLRLHWRLGVKLAPGMAVRLGRLGDVSGVYIVTDTSGELCSIDPWTVTCISVRDPVASIAADDTSTDAMNTDETDLGSDATVDETPSTLFNPDRALNVDMRQVEIMPAGSNPATGGTLTGALGLFGNPNATSRRNAGTAGAARPTAPVNRIAGRNANAVALYNVMVARGLFVDGFSVSAKHHADNPNSDHETGDAIDIHIAGHEADDLRAELIASADDYGIKYLINQEHIYNDSDGFTQRPFSGRYANGAIKNPHLTHIHVSFYR